jgi:hypothetical protein
MSPDTAKMPRPEVAIPAFPIKGPGKPIDRMPLTPGGFIAARNSNPMNAPEATSRTSGFPIRPLSGSSGLVRPLILLIPFLLAGAVFYLTQSGLYALIAFAVGFLACARFVTSIKCPQCQARLQSREESHRVCYDCSGCRITWDGGNAARDTGDD